MILVHGEANEMNRLKNALIREYEAEPQTKVHNRVVPRLPELALGSQRESGCGNHAI